MTLGKMFDNSTCETVISTYLQQRQSGAALANTVLMTVCYRVSKS